MKHDQILQLTTADEKSKAKGALEKAIIAAQNSDVFEHLRVQWSDAVWDIKSVSNKESASAKSEKLHFRPVAQRGHKETEKEYTRYWEDFVKLIMIQKIQDRFDSGKKFSASTLGGYSVVLRRLVDSIRIEGVQCVTEVTKPQMQSALIASVKHNNEKAIAKSIIVSLIDLGVAPQLKGLEFESKKKRDHKQVELSPVKPTDWNDIVALAMTYQLLESEQSSLKDRSDFNFMRYNMALANLLACAPSRVSELWRLPHDTAILNNPLEDQDISRALHDEDRDTLDFKFAMTWFPVKGGKPVIKPVPGAMQFVAKRCLEILADYSEEPRRMAKWIMDNPGVMPIPEDCKDLRALRDDPNARISPAEVARLLGVSSISKCRFWEEKFKRTRRTRLGSCRYGTTTYCFKTMQQEWWLEFQRLFSQSFKSDWPYVVNSDTLQLTADRALMLVFKGTLDPLAINENRLFLTTLQSQALDTILGETKNGALSFWDRLNIRLPNKKSPNINTHQIRHFLNTMAQRAGVPQAVIAMWSGRVRIPQNVTYDHRTDTERLRAHGYDISDYDEMQVDDLLYRRVEQLYTGTVGLPSVEVLSANEGDIRELQKKRIVSITQFGYCIGDLHSDPCPKAVNCLSCARLVTCKGAQNATMFLEQKLRKLESQKAQIELHIDEDGGWRLGSDRILPLLEEQISGAKDLLTTLNDPSVPDGSLILMRDYRGAQTASLSDRAKAFIEQRKRLEAKPKEVTDGET